MTNYFLKNRDKITDQFLKGAMENNIIPHDPKKILYKYVIYEVAEIILTKATLRFSSPTEFNAPIELSLDSLNYGTEIELIKNRMRKTWKKVNPQASIKMESQFINKYSNEEIISAAKTYFKQQRNQSLILCASLEPTIPLLWSYYSDSHKGVCVGFYMPTFYDPCHMICRHVHYSELMKPLTVYDDNDTARLYELISWYDFGLFIMHQKNITIYLSDNSEMEAECESAQMNALSIFENGSNNVSLEMSPVVTTNKFIRVRSAYLHLNGAKLYLGPVQIDSLKLQSADSAVIQLSGFSTNKMNK